MIDSELNRPQISRPKFNLSYRRGILAVDGREERLEDRRFLVLYILLDYFDGSTAARGSEVGRRPEVIAPEKLFQVTAMRLSKQSAGNPFEGINEFGEFDSGRVVDHQVNVILLLH